MTKILEIKAPHTAATHKLTPSSVRTSGSAALARIFSAAEATIEPELAKFISIVPTASSTPPKAAASAQPQIAIAPNSTAAQITAVLQNEFDALEKWATEIGKSSTHDFVGFLLTKFFVFSGSLGAMLLVHHGMSAWVPMLGGASTLVTALDTIRPSGTLYKTHRLAQAEIQMLLDDARSSWRIAQIAHPDSTHPGLVDGAVAVLERIRVRREQISRVVSTVESTMSSDDRSQTRSQQTPVK